MWFRPNVEKLRGRHDVPGLVKALKYHDPEVRRDAGNSLEQLADARSVGPFSAALRHDDSEVSHYAAEVLGNFGGSAVESLCAALGKGHRHVRWKVAEALGKIGDPRAVEALCVALRDHRDINTRRSAAKALGRIGDPRAVEPLLVAASDRDTYQIAADALVEIGEPAVEPLCLVFRTPRSSESAVRKAAELLGRIGEPAVEPLCAVLLDPMGLGKGWAGKALAEIGGPAVEGLCSALRGGENNVRSIATVELGTIGDPRGIEDLCDALGELYPKWLLSEFLAALTRLVERGASSATPEQLERVNRLEDAYPERHCTPAPAYGFEDTEEWVPNSTETVKRLVREELIRRRLAD